MSSSQIATMSPNYESATTFAERVKDAYTETKVSPEWIEDTGNFWYRRDYGPERFSFVFVNANQGVRRTAFDHKKLADMLSEHGIEANENTLPFRWINLSGDGKSVRFRIGETKWQFSDDQTLTEYHGDIHEEELQPMSKEKPSKSNSIKTSIKFLNRCKKSVDIYWIDWDGEPMYYETIKPGNSTWRNTYAEHVWRVQDSETKESIASFIARSNDATAIIEEGKSFTAEVATGRVSETSKDKPKVFVKDYNVWVRDADKEETQITTSGTKENPFDDKIYPSPDGNFAVVYQYTPAQDHLLYFIESSPKDQIQPRLTQNQYLKPGDTVRVDRPRLFDVISKKEVETDNSLFQNPYKTEGMGWSSDGSEYRFIYNQRGHQIIRIIGIDIKGHVRSIVEETSKTFIDYSQKQYDHQIKNSNELIWASERDGWNHLYLFDMETGAVKNQITTGPWVVYSVERVDEEKRQIWFKALGFSKEDPYYIDLVRADLDRPNFTILTEGNGTHKWSWSPDYKYLIDTWSRVDTAPQTALRDGETGKEVIILEQGNLKRLCEVGWAPPERFSAPGRDGKTMIYGIITRPFDFDPQKKYPIIEEIYAGPQDFFVPKAFSTLMRHHELAEIGFIVVQIDGMGTSGRGKTFQDISWKNLKDAGVPDRIAWMKAAAESRPWMNLDRVGLYGGSAGGQNAMGALLFHGNFYKAGVADCGCHDNRMDKIWWGEQYMGWPVDQSYEDSSTVVHASKLRGALMLIVGELDDNVDPSSTMQVVNALNKAEKDYELLFLPGGDHCFGSRDPYALRRQSDFFVRHLMGAEPPKRN